MNNNNNNNNANGNNMELEKENSSNSNKGWQITYFQNNTTLKLNNNDDNISNNSNTYSNNLRTCHTEKDNYNNNKMEIEMECVTHELENEKTLKINSPK